MKCRFSLIVAAAGLLLASAASAASAARSHPGDDRAASAADACKLVGAPARDFESRVPFEVVDGRIYVQARVNGRGPFRFAVDTGASGWGRADTTLVSALHLKTGMPTTTSDGMQKAQVATVHLDSLELGGVSRQSLDVITRDYDSRMSPDAAFSGIIGREFFADGLLIIDYPERTLSFSRKLSLSPTGPNVLRYERAFRVPVSIGKVRTEGNLDTGADVAFVLPKSLFERVSDSPLQQAGAGRLTNSRIQTMRSTVHGPFRIGGVSLSDVPVRVSDRYPELLVGAHALQHFVLMIDQRSRSIALCN
ncbi:MAG TPA: aspartyl protease family protein [Rhodanobacteraceae bacterium]|nr:aspartyl protease family protein [Rhodanobacteraceae bacterium]